MDPDPTTLRTRRAVLGAALGAAAATAAVALIPSASAEAADGGNLILGQSNDAASITRLSSATAGETLEVESTNPTGHAIHATGTGYPTVFVEHTSSPAIFAEGHGTAGVIVSQALGGHGAGVIGTGGINYSTPPDATGVFGYGAEGVVGQSPGQVGVHGYGATGLESPPTAASITNAIPTGVYGEATGTDPTGVWGEGGTATSGSTTGVYGEGDTGVWGFGGWGVFGASDATGTGTYGFSGASVPAAPAHTGVFGYSDSGVGVYAKAATGTALYVNGKAGFSRSGRVAITSGHSSVAKTLAGVTSSSLIIAVMQTYRAGFYLAAAVPAAGKFTVYLNKAVTATTYVAYFVVN